MDLLSSFLTEHLQKVLPKITELILLALYPTYENISPDQTENR